jgi:hypothetical protein
MANRGKTIDAMQRAVNAWEILKTLQSVEIMYRLKMKSVLELIDKDDYEYLDCLFIQIEPSKIPDLIIPVLRTAFAHRHNLVAWDQLRDKAWALCKSPEWRRAMRGLQPNHCLEYGQFRESGGYNQLVNKVLGV